MNYTYLTKWREEPCSFEGCINKKSHKTTGLCSTHYSQHRAGKELRPIGMRFYPTDAVCKIEGCNKKPKSHWMCVNHYQLDRYNKNHAKADGMNEDERQCNFCRKVKHWTQFARKEDTYKLECMDCYRKRLFPPKQERRTQTLNEFLKTLPNCNTNEESGVQ